MFKGSRWRGDKNRIIAVFKFQFHATQVSEFGGNGMIISVVPADNGKPTAKLEKCVIRENCCYWENPVCETVKFIQDPKAGKIREKIYYFIVSAGSPEGSLVGEFSVNIADYLQVTKGCSISFPFKKSISNSHLHVLIQRIQESGNQRHLGDNEVEEKSLRQHFSQGYVQEGVKTNYIGDEPLRKTISHMPGLSGTHRGSSGSDITLLSSESSSGLNTPRESGARHNNGNIEEGSNGSSYQDQQRTQWDLAIVPVNGASSDFSRNSPRDVFASDKSQIGLDESVDKIKANLVALSRRAEVSEIELQTLRKQIVKESKKGQDLLKEVASLKEERDALKDECKKLKVSRQFTDDLSKLHFKEDPWTLLEKIQEELNHEKDLNANLRIQLQKTQESNADLLLAVQDLEETSKMNNKPQQPNRFSCNGSVVQSEESILNCPSDDEEQRALEELVKQHSDAQETYLLEQKVMDLCSELEMYRRDKDELEMQMEQLALDYEILKQENHEFATKLELSHQQVQMKMQYDSSSSYATIVELEVQREKLQHELNKKSGELSDCLATIKELEVCKENLEKQMDECKAEKEAVAHSCTEQEQRAARAEAALSHSTATVNKLEAEMQKLKTDLKKQFQELSRCFTAMHGLETHRHNLEDELLKQAQEFQADIEALSRANKEHEQRALEAAKAVQCSKTTIAELNRNITKLENELKRHSEESVGTIAKFKKLEAHIQDLEEEMDKQVEGFAADLEAVTEAKMEQEKRAIHAEEALRLMKWKNVSTAARIQDEFKRLSLEMQSSFKSNEKLAIRALAESGELRLQNRHLRDMLQKANKELHSARHDYDSKMQELNDQINMKSIKLEQMVVEFEDKCKHFESQIYHIDELHESVFLQHLELRGELDRLDTENDLLAQHAKQGKKVKVEPERIKALFEERDLYVVEENMEGDDLEDIDAPTKVDVKDEREHIILDMCSEAEILRVECENLKHCLYEDELEKEKLRKQVFQLKADLKKKEDVISSIEKYKESNVHVLVQDRSRTTSKGTKSESVQRGAIEAGAKEVATLKDTIKLLEEKVSVGKQADYLADEITSASDIPEVSISFENLNNVDSQAQMLHDSQDTALEISSNEEQNFDILLKEMVLLKERNNSTELELKEIQERYSDMSVKFAEVEGERQKLVMALRNVKNAKRS